MGIYTVLLKGEALYAYNAENCLIRAAVQSGNNVFVGEYEYNYAGNRTVKKTEGGYTKYLLDVIVEIYEAVLL